jgi:hypothetical protein
MARQSALRHIANFCRRTAYVYNGRVETAAGSLKQNGHFRFRITKNICRRTEK